MAETANAVVDLGDLCKVYPFPERSFARNNLRAIWPNYAAIPDLKLVVPSVIAHDRPAEGAAREVIRKAGWQSR